MSNSRHQIGSLPFETPGYSRSQTHMPLPSQAYHSRFQYMAHPLSSQSQSGAQEMFIDPSGSGFGDLFNQSIDLDYDYPPAPGTPTVGVYSRDGLWDDEEEEGEARSASGPSSSVASSSRNTSVATGSNNARSRSNTINATEDKGHGRGTWNWRRPSTAHTHDQSPVLGMEVVEKPAKGLEKKKSKGLLRGKGRRGELTVAVAPDAEESFEAPPQMPPTPASFFTESSPASFFSATFSPVNYPSPILDTPSSMSTLPPTSTSTSISTSANPTSGKPKATSSWKRGMQKIFKSKSSAVLREAASKGSTPPPLPRLPAPTVHAFDKPFSSSTPPLGESRRVNVNLPGYLSTPPSATAGSFVLSDLPSLPHDPFASSLYLSSNQPLPSPAFAKPRPALRNNSPSLRDLKNLLPINTKPKLSKAKSLANLQHRHFDGPKSAPLERTEYFPPAPRTGYTKRMSSLVGLNIFADAAPEHRQEGFELAHPPTQASLALPVESPPLLPPHPPFASTSRSCSLPSITTDTGSSSSEDSSRVSMPPNAPLPPVPSSGSSPTLAAPIQHSGSGAVLLPRSRSTSMSIKSPPTSSSFFDLYEQLGIWPNAEKEKEKQRQEKETVEETSPLVGEAEVEEASMRQLAVTEEPEELEEDEENASPDVDDVEQIDEDRAAEPLTEETPVTTGSHLEAQMPTSESLGSTASWNVALDSFPDAPADEALDFGLPFLADDEGVEAIADPLQRTTDTSDALSIMAVAASSRNSSHNTTIDTVISTNNRTSSSTTTQATSVGMQYVQSSQSSRRRGRGSGSGDSSRDGSPDRRRGSQSDREEQQSDDSSSDEDDVPLSKLHPDAAATQAQRREARRASRAARKAQLQAKRSQGETVATAKSDKTHGRNPGGESSWDGEGGVPADILFRKLEAVVMRRAERGAAAMAMSAAASSDQHQHRHHNEPIIPQGLKARRSIREHVPLTLDQSLRRAQSQGHVHAGQPSSGWRHGDIPPLPPLQTAIPPRHSPTTPTYSHPAHGVGPSSAISPTDVSFGRIPSARRVDAVHAHGHTRHTHGDPTYADRSRQNSEATSVSSRTPHAPSGSRAPSRQDDQSHSSSGEVTRSNTTATQYSSSSRQRAQAHSNAAPPHSHRDEPSALHARAITQSLSAPAAPAQNPALPKAAANVPAFVSALNGKRVMLEITPTTTAREVLVSTYHNGDLVDATVGMSWVLCEVFAEMGCERQVREYEPLLPIIKGWDHTAKFNCFVFKQSNRGMLTWARTVPTTPPMIGSWVHHETKKGKWAKRWLETRGGQVFLAKNEKNKDEVHINILFFDIYGVTRPYDSPKPSTFMMKRVEPASTFENPSDYAHVFSCEDGQAFKLMSAIYDAKSYTLGQAHPSMITNLSSLANATQSVDRRPTVHRHAPGHGVVQPLVSLSSEEDKAKAPFTGKGLLKI